ncbi:hypothetical protein [Treponema sp.]|uniref:hypothetical protein n=1 Tax=Treponema sp. TaxID=166 RepID=UPI002A7FB788|nr:hypothetical protein [Treponema sp.]MDY4131833.1 hypothetical protein [Treponema sp.]
MNNYETVSSMLQEFLAKGTYLKGGLNEDEMFFLMKKSIVSIDLKFFDGEERLFSCLINTNDGETHEIEIGWYELDSNSNLIETSGSLAYCESKWYSKKNI